MDNPTDYVNGIKSENRCLRARLEQAERLAADLREDLRRSDEIRAAVKDIAADVSQDMVTALTRLEHYQAIVDAAVEWADAGVAGIPIAIHNLKQVVTAEIKRRAGRS